MSDRIGWTSALRGMALGACLVVGATGAWAQERPAAAAPSAQGNEQAQALEPGEVGRLFDAYALMQAQDVLGLDETQYERFVGRFRALLETRRRHAMVRTRMVRDLAQLSRADSPDEEALRAGLKTLDEEIGRGRADAAQAQQGVDEVLTLAQRARFRVLEDQLERRRWELMSRARQQARPRRGPAREP